MVNLLKTKHRDIVNGWTEILKRITSFPPISIISTSFNLQFFSFYMKVPNTQVKNEAVSLFPGKCFVYKEFYLDFEDCFR